MEQLMMYFAVGSPLLAAGAAWGGVRYGLNGTKEAVRRIETKLDRYDQRLGGVEVDVAVLRALGRAGEIRRVAVQEEKDRG